MKKYKIIIIFIIILNIFWKYKPNRNYYVRASEKFALEMHVDIEEGNAAGVKNGDLVELIK